MRIVILTSETPANVWLVNQILAGPHAVAGLVIERPPLARTRAERIQRRRRMLQRHGFARTFNKLLYNWFRSRLSADAGAAAKKHFFPDGAPVAYSRDIPSLIVHSINHTESVRFIERCAPDALAVCGTRVIRPEVFSRAPKGALNIHTGITPEYRSADPIFWALYRGEPHKVGVTIHYIDSGIDSGPVIHQDTVPVYANDSLVSIYFRCVRRGAELYLRALSEVADGSVRTRDRGATENHAYRSIDLGIVQYVRFHFRFRKMTKHLPIREPVTLPARAAGR